MTRDKFTGITEQAKAGKHRLEDAKALFQMSRWRGCMYLAGYGIECLLKTKLMGMFDCYHLAELEAELRNRGVLAADATIFTHHLEVLLRLTNAMDRLRRDEPLWRMFSIVNRWMPAWRYTANRASQEDAEDFLEAIEKVSHWIENSI